MSTAISSPATIETLADLHERAGDLPAARPLFRRVSAEDPASVDVAERLAALS